MFFIVLLKLCRMCRKSYCFSLPWTMTTFFLFQLPGLCGSGAYVFSSGNRNSLRDLGEVASAWITEVYRCRANRGRHLPSEKLKVVCRNGWTPRSMSSTRPSVFVYLPSMSSLWSLVNEFVETAGRMHFNHAWLLLCWCVHGSPH